MIRLGDKSSERLTVLWHKQQHSWADHAAPCLRARGHFYTVGRVEFLHFNKSHSGVCVDLSGLCQKKNNTNNTLTLIVDFTLL